MSLHLAVCVFISKVVPFGWASTHTVSDSGRSTGINMGKTESFY